jgi:hypothetical protein
MEVGKLTKSSPWGTMTFISDDLDVTISTECLASLETNIWMPSELSIDTIGTVLVTCEQTFDQIKDG